MPVVLKMARQINQASWLLRALFHMAMTFQTPSQSARRTMATMNKANSGFFMVLSWWIFVLVRSFDKMTGWVSPVRQDGFANFDELVRVARREADAFEQAGFFYQQNGAAEVASVQLHAPDRTRRARFDGLNSVCRHHNDVEKKPGLQFKPVAVDAILQIG